MLKIYVASRYNKAPMWIDLQNSPEFKHFIVSRWLHHYQMGTRETPHNSKIFWPENIEDIKIADIVLYYAEEDDIQGGALIEVGAALANNKRILVVGKNESHRSWIYHPNVLTFDSLEDAIIELDYTDIELGRALE